MRRKMAAFTAARAQSLIVRAVPSKSARSGMTLVAVPAWMIPTVTTAGSVGSRSRLTICWRLTTASHAATIGSTPRWGNAAMATLADDGGPEEIDGRHERARFGGNATDRQARPAVQRRRSLEPRARFAHRAPGANQPVGPAAFFLRRLKINLTQTESWSCSSRRMAAAPSNAAIWPSCPQACMRPGWVLAIRQAGLFDDRKCVDIGAQGDAGFGRVADQADGRGGRVGHAVDVADSQPIEFGADDRRPFEIPRTPTPECDAADVEVPRRGRSPPGWPNRDSFRHHTAPPP